MASLNMKKVNFMIAVLAWGLVSVKCNAQTYTAQAYQVGEVPVVMAQVQPQQQTQMMPVQGNQYEYSTWYNTPAMPNTQGAWTNNNNWAADNKSYQGTPYDHSTYGGDYWGQQIPGQNIRSGGFTQGGTITATMPPLPPEQNLMYPVMPPSSQYVPNYPEMNELAGQIVNQTVENCPPPAGVSLIQDWVAKDGQTLKIVLQSWADRSGWQLVWNTERDYKIAAGAVFRGKFIDVVSALVKTYARARPAPVATFYKGNKVLLIDILENENVY